ncbi:MAG: M48 family metallopeptidase [Bradyrhizobiaceae bacterium]|nr:M48 family metallopeptidase [Bradyrhizobiaceae bacterium]
MTGGTGIFYDGLTSDRHKVAVGIADGVIVVTATDGAVKARWPLDQVYPLATSNEVLRLGLADDKVAARLEILDAELATALLSHLKQTDRSGFTDRRTRFKVVGYSLAAIATLVGGAIWGIPLLADRIAPHLPLAWEIRLGDAVDAQVRRTLDPSKGRKPFDCGAGEAATTVAARNAFMKLVALLEAGAALPVPLHASVVRSPEVNAITLPGGHVYVFEGLLNKAAAADELAGVLGHELGHVAHRDGTKAVLEAAGLSLLFGMLLGDFTGGGAVVLAARSVLETTYSRTAETAADEFSARLMYKMGGDPRALGTILLRISGKPGIAPHFLLDHPEAQERADAIARIGRPSPMKAVLTPAEWNALRGICNEEKSR